MFKRTEQSGATKQLRKTKLVDSYKNIAKQQQTIVHRSPCSSSNRIMLTDLCPEQKAKIGELVKTLEIRKKQNKILEEKIDLMGHTQTVHQQKIKQLQKSIQLLTLNEESFKKKINLLETKALQREEQISHLNSEITEYKGKRFYEDKPKVDQFSMTDPVFKNQQGCQAIPKRKKQKQKAIQTEECEREKNRGYPNNSKSFDKIMKTVKTNKSSQKVTSRNQHSNKSTRKMYSDIKISDQQQYDEIKQSNHYKNNYLINQEEANEEEFDQLAQKWLELKQRNMSKIKQSYSKNKGAMQYEVEPRQFEEGIYDYEQDSFGPHRKRYQQNQEEFDEIELNRILKSKNFSASRLLQNNKNSREGSGNRVTSQQSVRKLKKDNKSQIFKKKNQLKKSNASNSRNIDFYQTDLLDLVSSINPQ